MTVLLFRYTCFIRDKIQQNSSKSMVDPLYFYYVWFATRIEDIHVYEIPIFKLRSLNNRLLKS